MSFKDQFKTIKENWLIVVLILVVLLIPIFGSGNSSYSYNGFADSFDMALSAPMYEKSMVASSRSYGGGVYYEQDFAPEVEERKITKTTSMSNEIERGNFKEAENKLKSIVTSSDSFLLYENSNLYGKDRSSYYQGSYQIKVETEKYDAIVSQLKEIGEVTSFNENKRDITGSYENTEIELEVEKDRLKRYQEMYAEVEDIGDKIDLSDRIFNQERTIKYLEDSLENMDKKVDYSTISVNLREEQSDYVDIALIKFSELIRNLVNSFNSLLSLIFVALPYAIVGGLIWLIVKLTRKKKVIKNK